MAGATTPAKVDMGSIASRRTKGSRSWVQFVKVRRADFSASSVTAYSRICSAHFKEGDYHSGDAKMVSLGLKNKRTAKLIPTAVPSVHANHSAWPVQRLRDTVCRKREIATVSIML